MHPRAVAYVLRTRHSRQVPDRSRRAYFKSRRLASDFHARSKELGFWAAIVPTVGGYAVHWR